MCAPPAPLNSSRRRPAYERLRSRRYRRSAIYTTIVPIKIAVHRSKEPVEAFLARPHGQALGLPHERFPAMVHRGESGSMTVIYGGYVSPESDVWK
jgi:hypothetical protein